MFAKRLLKGAILPPELRKQFAGGLAGTPTSPPEFHKNPERRGWEPRVVDDEDELFTHKDMGFPDDASMPKKKHPSLGGPDSPSATGTLLKLRGKTPLKDHPHPDEDKKFPKLPADMGFHDTADGATPATTREENMADEHYRRRQHTKFPDSGKGKPMFASAGRIDGKRIEPKPIRGGAG